MLSELSFEEYASWCKSRYPAIDPGPAPGSCHDTFMATGDEEACPVTVRSRHGDDLVLTPRPKGSR